MNGQPAPYLQRTIWTEIFTAYYVLIMVLAWINFGRAFRRTLTRSGRRRMVYLLAGATAPALGSFPYLLYGSSVAANFPFLFWGMATASNFLVGGLIIVMAYAVAFFGVSWPDRVVKSRLFKWIMRGPVVASVALGVMTIIRRSGEHFGTTYSAAVPAAMVATVLILEHTITLVAPLWERFIFFGGDRTDLALLQNLEERLITQNDLRQFLEAVLAAVRDHLQSPAAFVAALDGEELSLVVATGSSPLLKESNLSEVLQVINHEGNGDGEEYAWGDYWLFPLHQPAETDGRFPDFAWFAGGCPSTRPGHCARPAPVTGITSPAGPGGPAGSSPATNAFFALSKTCARRWICSNACARSDGMIARPACWRKLCRPDRIWRNGCGMPWHITGEARN